MAENSISVLFRSCASGLESACEELFLSLRPVLERIATRVAKQFHAPSEIEDVVQEMCLRISEKKSFLVEALPDGDDPAKRYLAVMAANVARDWFRGRLAKSRKFDVTISIDSRIPELALALGVYPDYNHDYLLDRLKTVCPGIAASKRFSGFTIFLATRQPRSHVSPPLV